MSAPFYCTICWNCRSQISVSAKNEFTCPHCGCQQSPTRLLAEFCRERGVDDACKLSDLDQAWCFPLVRWLYQRAERRRKCFPSLYT